MNDLAIPDDWRPIFDDLSAIRHELSDIATALRDRSRYDKPECDPAIADLIRSAIIWGSWREQ